MKKYTTLILMLSFANLIHAQTPGLIYKPSSSEFGRSILDPNGDGFTSTATDGFSASDFGADSELSMIPIPVFEEEPLNDLSTGSVGGHTDIASAKGAQSCYILKRTVNGVDYIVIRFRLGDASTASKGYSLLIDSDGIFGTALSSSNLGFDREIVYETGNNGRIAIYKHEVGAAGTLLASYNVHENSQRSVALSMAGGNPDYFYDFFVPLDAIDAPDPVRFSAVSVTNAGSGVLGTISDFNGINDKLYENNPMILQQIIINSFPAVNFDDLDEKFNTNSWKIKTSPPIISSGITPSSTTVSGASTEDDGTLIEVFLNQASIGTTTVTNNTWSISNLSGLTAGDIINSAANAAGKNISDFSTDVIVANAQSCFTSKPIKMKRGNKQTIAGDWSQTGVNPANNSIRIQLYEQNSVTNEISIRNDSPNHTVFVQSDDSWSMSIADKQNDFNDKSYLFKATIIANNCTSGFSNVSTKTNGGTGNITAAPLITSSQITDTSSGQQISVTNQDTQAAYLFLYVNGLEIQATTSTVNSNSTHAFTIAGLQSGDILTARAQVPLPEYWLSNASNEVNVGLSNPQSSIVPSISGNYIAGSAVTISGTSLEAAGTLITVLKNGNEADTTTVSAFGTWKLTGQTLTAGDNLTVKAKAPSKLESVPSSPVTVIAGLANPPTLNGPIYIGDTSITGSGVAAGKTIKILVDGDPIGTTTAGNDSKWNLNNFNPNDLYRGAEVTAVVLNNNIQGDPSSAIIISGLTDFSFTLSNGNAIPTNLNSGETIKLKITAQDCQNTPCTTDTNFTSPISLVSDALISPLGETSNFTNGELTITLTIGGSGNVRVVGTNPNDPSASGDFQIQVSPAIWVGNTSTDFNTASNWVTNSVPGNGADIMFDTNVQNNCVLSSNTSLNNIDFNTTTHSFSMDLNEKELSLRGALVNHTQQKALIASGEAKLNLLGSNETFDVYFTPSASLENLIINANTSQITLRSELRVTNKVELKQGTFNTGDLLVFAVTPPATETDEAKDASFFYESGTLNGEVTVEKYYPIRRAFRMVASPVNTGSKSIFDNWQNGGTYSAGIGTHITGEQGIVGGFNPTTGIDYTASGNKSLYLFNNGWQEITNTKNTPLRVGFPYRLMVRGDRNLSNISNNTNTNTTIIRSKGTLVTGNQDLVPPTASTTGGNPNHFSLLANPYQAAIDVSSILFRPKNSGKARTNAFFVWDPMINNRGAFVTVEDLVNGGVPVQTNSSASNLVKPGLAFFIQSNTKNPNINFTESMKVIPTSSSNKSAPMSNNQMSLLVELRNSNNQIIDAIRLRFTADGDNGKDILDVSKMGNIDENLASINENSLFTIQHRNFPENEEEIPLFTNNWRNQDYSFMASLSNFGTTEVYLTDAYLGKETLLKDGKPYNFEVDTTIPASKNTKRFSLKFGNETMSVEDLENNLMNLYPNPAQEVVNIQTNLALGTQVDVEIYNMLGQQVYAKQQELNSSTLQVDINTLNSGIYMVKLIDEVGSQYSHKLIKR